MHNTRAFQRTLVALLLAAGAGAVLAQTAKVDLGKREYLNKCAACHGASGRGDGSFSDMLTRRPADLTGLAKRNNGIFPVARVYEVIEGGGSAHGSRDMPVFGLDYKVQAAEYYHDVPYDPEVYVRGRILSLVEYLNRIQVK